MAKKTTRRREENEAKPSIAAPSAEVKKKSFSALQALILALAMPATLLALRLDTDVWYDEAYTLQKFVSRSVDKIVTDYSAPNNHVLYSVLLRPVYLQWRDNFSLRFPSFLFSLGTMFFVFRMGQRWGGASAGMLAASSLGLNVMFLVHAPQIRGYALSMFLMAWLADLILSENDSHQSKVLRAVVGAALVYVMPTNLLFWIPLVLWDFTRQLTRQEFPGSAIVRVGWPWALSLGLIAVCYAPIYAQVLDSRGARPDGVWGMLFGVGRAFFLGFFHDCWPLLPLWIFGGVLIWKESRRSRSATISGQVSAPTEEALASAPESKVLFSPFVFVLWGLVSAWGLAAILGMIPFERNFLPLLPLLALVQGRLLAHAGNWLFGKFTTSPRADLVAVALLALVAAVYLPAVFLYPSRLDKLRDKESMQGAYYNFYAARYRPSQVIRQLNEDIPRGQSYGILYSLMDSFALEHYFRYYGLNPVYLPRRDDGSTDFQLYVILPQAGDWNELRRENPFLPPEEGFELWKNVDYYRVYRYRKPLPVDILNPTQASPRPKISEI